MTGNVQRPWHADRVLAVMAMLLAGTLALEAAFARWLPPGSALTPQAEKVIRLSLTQEFGRAVFSECRLDVGTYGGAGSAAVRCVRTGKPPVEVVRERKLTTQETTRLIELARESSLLTGDHIGTDTTAADGVFETLKVTDSAGTGVLVTSGNASFTTGARRALLDLLHTLLYELQKNAK
jgi:hypothetical protein